MQADAASRKKGRSKPDRMLRLAPGEVDWQTDIPASTVFDHASNLPPLLPKNQTASRQANLNPVMTRVGDQADFVFTRLEMGKINGLTREDQIMSRFTLSP